MSADPRLGCRIAILNCRTLRCSHTKEGDISFDNPMTKQTEEQADGHTEVDRMQVVDDATQEAELSNEL